MELYKESVMIITMEIFILENKQNIQSISISVLEIEFFLPIVKIKIIKTIIQIIYEFGIDFILLL